MAHHAGTPLVFQYRRQHSTAAFCAEPFPRHIEADWAGLRACCSLHHHVLGLWGQSIGSWAATACRCAGAAQAMPGGGLAYFNCGEHSGASQPHKHTQVVPLPLATPAELTRGAEASASAPGPSSGPPVEDRPAGLGPEASGVSAPAAAGPEGSRSSPPAAPAAPGLRRAGSGGAGEAGVCGGEAAAAGGGAAGEGVPPLLDVLADEALRAAGAAAWEARPLRSLPFQCFCAALPARCPAPSPQPQAFHPAGVKSIRCVVFRVCAKVPVRGRKTVTCGAPECTRRMHVAAR